jgi:hypothetical protein
MTKSTTSDAIFSFFLDGLCASTAMKVNSQDDDDNSVSEGRSGDLEVSDFYFDLPSPQQHYICDPDDEERCSGIEYNERSSPPMIPAKSYDGTHVTAAMTWESSFDLNDAMSTELNCIQDIFEPYDEQFHSFSEDTTNSNSIFRSNDNYDHEQRKQYGTLVRMKHANYAHETLKSPPPRILKSKTLNDRPSSPTYLKYPDEKAMEEARRQFVRHHSSAEQHHELHNLVMGRAA